MSEVPESRDISGTVNEVIDRLYGHPAVGWAKGVSTRELVGEFNRLPERVAGLALARGRAILADQICHPDDIPSFEYIMAFGWIMIEMERRSARSAGHRDPA